MGDADQFRPVQTVLSPQSVAIVGASERGRWPQDIFNASVEGGYAGDIFLINPRQSEVYGRKAYPSLKDLPKTPDHAIVIVPGAAVPAVLEDAAAARREVGHGLCGRRRRRRQRSLARTRPRGARDRGAHGHSRRRPQLHGRVQLSRKAFRLSQPRRCESARRACRVRVPVRRHAAILHGHGRQPRPALLLRRLLGQRTRSRSRRLSELHGGRSAHAADRALHRGRAHAPGLHARRRTRARRAASRSSPSRPARARSRRRPRPRTRARSRAISPAIWRCASATASSTAATSTSWSKPTLAFQCGRAPKGPRVGWITTSGGTVDLLYDDIEREGSSLPSFADDTVAALQPFMQEGIKPKNPLDSGIPTNLKDAADICRIVAGDPNVDIVAWAGQLPATPERWAGVEEMKAMLEATGKPVVGFSRMAYQLSDFAPLAQEQAGFPFLQGLPQTCRALNALWFHARARASPSPRRRPRPSANSTRRTSTQALASRGVRGTGERVRADAGGRRRSGRRRSAFPSP